MKITFKIKLFATFVAFAIVLLAGTIGYVWIAIGDLPCEEAKMILLASASSAALAIDPEDIEAIRQSPDPASCRQYKKLVELFRKIDQAPPHFGLDDRRVEVNGIEKEIYILAATDRPDVGRWLVTMTSREIGKDYDMKRFPAMMKGWTEVTADDQVQQDEFGRSLSAYAPIRDKTGKTVAMLGIDAYGEFIDVADREIMRAAVTLFIAALLLSILPSLYFSVKLNRPIALLHQAMEKVAGGDLSARIEKPPRTGDEFDRLIAHFNNMLSGLAERQELIRSMELARDIQQNLLPKEAPAFGGFDIFGAVHYCDRTGGDYIDFIKIGDSPARLGIAIGDVTGHGISAALLMAFTRALLHSLAGRHAGQAGRLFDEMNAHLARDCGNERFVTLFYGMLEEGGSLEWVSAGHEAGVLVRAGGAVEEMPCTNLPLGVIEDAKYEPGGPVRLNAGDILVIGTDGIREAFNEAGGQFGQDRLAETIAISARLPAADIHRAVIEAVEKFRGPVKQADDIALIVIKRLM
ncbi:MAG: SpoIIE family protein phosphatase [Planctomycetes bacterium]|nr:SpoIIE family protein phosphatase [Planctomycetota bacterium]